jgi:hypothetical protein
MVRLEGETSNAPASQARAAAGAAPIWRRERSELPRNQEMARSGRFELPTPRFVVSHSGAFFGFLKFVFLI